ncbi:MAG: nucleoside hydrolase, partial [Candidatus Sumerlaeales bacterium]|nr:nucleoside hydrolase [Candidatus Sumerlaeales bacterium]
MMKKIILDCDPGHDDALAMMLAVASDEIDLLAVTTSAGNQRPEKTLHNALALLTLMGRTDIPVAGGNRKPLINPLMIADNIHGDSGLDGAT